MMCAVGYSKKKVRGGRAYFCIEGFTQCHRGSEGNEGGGWKKEKLSSRSYLPISRSRKILEVYDEQPEIGSENN